MTVYLVKYPISPPGFKTGACGAKFIVAYHDQEKARRAADEVSDVGGPFVVGIGYDELLKKISGTGFVGVVIGDLIS